MANKEDREIYLSGEVDRDMVITVAREIRRLNHMDDRSVSTIKDFVREEIAVVLNTQGGAFNDAAAIVDIVNNSITPVKIIGVSELYSAGFIIFCGIKNREIYPHCSLMLHDLARSGWGYDHTAVARSVGECGKSLNLMKKIISDNTRIPMDKFDEYLERRQNWYMTIDEAKEYIDFKILTPENK